MVLTVRSRTVIETDTPGQLIGARSDIRRRSVSTARPPAASLVSCRGGVCGATASDGGLNVGNLDTRRGDLGNPLLDLSRGSVGRLVQSRVI